ncbi:hypothetical protein ACSNOH_29255 [Streptomyces sp. URMC 127]|uniref:hypothetical protein n=1 Tax=Streptomyces sp. URMC 127 TaxID=3423402 RepID=UPI003F1DFAB8
MLATPRIIVIGDAAPVRSHTAPPREAIKQRTLEEHFTSRGNTVLNGRRVSVYERH